MHIQDYNPNIHCDVCCGTGLPSSGSLPHATHCWYCQGSTFLPTCLKCNNNGVWSGSYVCNQCDTDPPDDELDLNQPMYRSHYTEEISVEVKIDTTRTIEIIYNSPLLGEAKYKQINDPTEVKLRYFIYSFRESTPEKFNRVKKLLLTRSNRGTIHHNYGEKG